MLGTILMILIGIIIIGCLWYSIKIVRQTQRGIVERFGKYNRFLEPGLNFIIPIIERFATENITERMVDANRQEIITKDNLNANVDAQIYYKIRSDEGSIKDSFYNVFNVQEQIVALARTTLRNIIGTLTLSEANSERNKINGRLVEELSEETKNWGIEVIRAELKEIDPPKDVQEAMNKVVKAENQRIAAKDLALANEIEADGIKKASIKQAEGQKRSIILQSEAKKQSKQLIAEGEANAIKLVNEAADKYFKGNAQLLKKLETTERSLSRNSKIIIQGKTELVNVISDVAGIVPIKKSDKK